VIAFLLNLALMAQAVTGVADPAQRFAPVPGPAGMADPCRERGPVGRWTKVSEDGAPKSLHDQGWLDSAAVWTGTRMVIARRRDNKWNGTAFDPCANAWSPTPETNEPPPGGPWPFPDGVDRPFRPSYDGSSWSTFDKISVWDPARKAWVAVTAKAGLAPRAHYAVALVGRRFFVWGGWSRALSVLGDGAVLDLGRKSWKKMTSLGAPSPRIEPTAVVWTGSRLLVWGGRKVTNAPYASRALGDGALYDPATDRWKPMSSENAPAPRTAATVVWTGRRLVVFGGAADVGGPRQHDGGIYDPATDRWAPLDPPPGAITLPQANVGPLTRIIVAPDGRVVFLPDNIDGVAVLDADRASWSVVAAAELGKRNGYRAFLLGRRLIIWGGSTVVAEHICPPPVPGQPICDSWAETAAHHDGWMILLPK